MIQLQYVSPLNHQILMLQILHILQSLTLDQQAESFVPPWSSRSSLPLTYY